jgi:hypothetical protein
MSRARSGYSGLVLIGAGFAAWGAIFVGMYGAQALGCRLDWGSIQITSALTLQRLAQIILYLVGLAATLGLWMRLRSLTDAPAVSATDRFTRKVSAWGGLAALGAVAFSFAGALWLSAC